MTSAVSNTLRFRPPYSSGTDMPSTPILASAFRLSQGYVPSRYLMELPRKSMSRDKSRTAPIKARWSSVRRSLWLFMMSVFRWIRCARGAGWRWRVWRAGSSPDHSGETWRAAFFEGRKALGIVDRAEDVGQRGTLEAQGVR